MAVRDIVLFLENAAALRKKSKPVRSINRRVKRLVRDLEDTLNDHPEGIGLAALQIDAHSRVVVVRLDNKRDSKREPDAPLSLINSGIMETRNEQRDFNGRSSFPVLCDEIVLPLSEGGWLGQNGSSFSSSL